MALTECNSRTKRKRFGYKRDSHVRPLCTSYFTERKTLTLSKVLQITFLHEAYELITAMIILHFANTDNNYATTRLFTSVAITHSVVWSR